MFCSMRGLHVEVENLDKSVRETRTECENNVVFHWAIKVFLYFRLLRSKIRNMLTRTYR